MTLRNKLTILSTLLFAFALGLVFLGTFLLFKEHTRELYFKKLLERANTAAYFYFEKDEVNDKKYRSIEAQYRRIYNESIRVYHADNKSVFIDDKLNFKLSDETLNKIVDEGNLTFKLGNKQLAGLYYKDNQGNFIIVISGVDIAGNVQLDALKKMLIFFYLLGALIHFLLAGFLAKKTFRPFATLIKKVNSITTDNLHSRLDVPVGHKDEIKELIITFNYFLARLENGVQTQKNFLKNASHELKTPLTAIMGDIDVTLNQPRSKEEYETLLISLKNDTVHLKSILDSLLILSGLEMSGEQKMVDVRIDEVLWNVLEKKAIEYPNAQVAVSVAISPLQEQLLTVRANRELLYIALSNLLDNAIKFSDAPQVKVSIASVNDQLQVAISDNGPGIPANDAEAVFELFYRSHQTRHIKGQGIGLYITKQILQLHHIELQLVSQPDQGTCVKLIF